MKRERYFFASIVDPSDVDSVVVQRDRLWSENAELRAKVARLDRERDFYRRKALEWMAGAARANGDSPDHAMSWAECELKLSLRREQGASE